MNLISSRFWLESAFLNLTWAVDASSNTRIASSTEAGSTRSKAASSSFRSVILVSHLVRVSRWCQCSNTHLQPRLRLRHPKTYRINWHQ